MLAYWGKKRNLVKIQRIENGVVYAYSFVQNEGKWFFPLVQDGTNVEEFEIIKNEQLSLFDMEG